MELEQHLIVAQIPFIVVRKSKNWALTINCRRLTIGSWEERAFNHVKATIAREVVLAYPDYSKVFEIYTDALSKQLGAVITQESRPIAFFSWKLSTTQPKYSVTKIDLLAIVETLKEF